MKMKGLKFVVLIGLLLSGSLTPLFAAEKPMKPVLKQLDLDGDFVLYMNTDTLEKYLLNYMNTMEKTLSGSMTTDSDKQSLKMGFEKLRAAISWSGLFSFKSYSASLAPVGKLTRQISFLEYDVADADKPLWKIVSSTPKVLEGIHYVPSDSVFVVNEALDINGIWDVIEEGVTTFGGVAGASGFQQKMMMAEMVLGTNITALTKSLDNELLISIQFSETKTVKLPIGHQLVGMPEPSWLIGLKTKNSLVGQLLISKLKASGAPFVESKYEAYTLQSITVPQSLSVPLKPTVVQTEDWLFFGTTAEVVKQALDSKQKKSGLISTALYKQLLPDVPQKVSSIRYISPRFFDIYLDFVNKAMMESGNKEQSDLMSLMFKNYKNLSSGSYSLKTPTGIYSKTYSNVNGIKMPEMLASTYIGMFSAIAIPSFVKARNNAMTSRAINNARWVLSAVDQYALENALESGASIKSSKLISKYIGSLDQLKIGELYPIIPAEFKVDASITPRQLAAKMYPTIFANKSALSY